MQFFLKFEIQKIDNILQVFIVKKSAPSVPASVIFEKSDIFENRVQVFMVDVFVIIQQTENLCRSINSSGVENAFKEEKTDWDHLRKIIILACIRK